MLFREDPGLMAGRAVISKTGRAVVRRTGISGNRRAQMRAFNERLSMFAAGTASRATLYGGGQLPATEFLGPLAHLLSQNALAVAGRVPVIVGDIGGAGLGFAEAVSYEPTRRGPRFGTITIRPGFEGQSGLVGHELFHNIDYSTQGRLSAATRAAATPGQISQVAASYGGGAGGQLAYYSSLPQRYSEFTAEAPRTSMFFAPMFGQTMPNLSAAYAPWLRQNPPRITARPITTLLQTLR